MITNQYIIVSSEFGKPLDFYSLEQKKSFIVIPAKSAQEANDEILGAFKIIYTAKNFSWDENLITGGGRLPIEIDAFWEKGLEDRNEFVRIMRLEILVEEEESINHPNHDWRNRYFILFTLRNKDDNMVDQSKLLGFYASNVKEFEEAMRQFSKAVNQKCTSYINGMKMDIYSMDVIMSGGRMAYQNIMDEAKSLKETGVSLWDQQ